MDKDTEIKNTKSTQEEQASTEATQENIEQEETQEQSEKNAPQENQDDSEKPKGKGKGKGTKNATAPKVEKKEHFIEAYKRAYPGEKAFHVTSDKQVFLEKGLSLAKLHQKSLKGGEIETIKVK